MSKAKPQWRARFAEHLLAEYRRVAKKKGKAARRRENALRYEALDMLEEMGAPQSVLALFDALLGGVVAGWDATEHERTWVRPAVEFEARAMRDGRAVSDAEIVDKVYMTHKPKGVTRAAALKTVREARRADFYRAFVMTREWELEKKGKT